MERSIKTAKISIALSTLAMFVAILNAIVAELNTSSILLLIGMFILLIVNYFNFSNLKKKEAELKNKNKK